MVSLRRAICVLMILAVALVLAAGCRNQPRTVSAEERAGDTTGVSGGVFAAAEKGISGKLSVAIPCGMIIPLKKAITVFRKSNPGLELAEDYDNAGVLVTKIIDRGDRPDLFVSPGITEIARLEKAGLVDPAKKVALGSFELCAIQRRGSKLSISKPEDLLQLKTLAMPDPTLNSVGACGEEALRSLGLWDRLQPNMVMPDQAIKAHNLVIEGKAEAGISYRACPLETNPDKMNDAQVKIVFDFPADSYERQSIWIAPLEGAANQAAAEAVIEFLQSRRGMQLLAQNELPGAMELYAAMGGTESEMVAETAESASEGEEEEGIRVLGPALAPIHVVAYYPRNETHEETWGVLDRLADRYAGQVCAELIDFESDRGFDRWNRDGYTCGLIVINGKSVFRVPSPSGEREVVLRRKMGQDWAEPDLYAVLDMLVAEAASGESEKH